VGEVSRSAGDPVKPVRLVSHLALIVTRVTATCLICHELMDEGEPPCERCGLGAFHLYCYTEAIARSPKERRFWATHSSAVAEVLTRFAPFLCPGCRS
jgi:hypothetical protein